MNNGKMGTTEKEFLTKDTEVSRRKETKKMGRAEG